MNMDMGNDGGMTTGPLSAAGVNFSDPDQASAFLSQLLNDDELKVIGNAYARYFWYGVVVVIGIAAIINWTRFLLLRMRLRAAARGVNLPATPKNAVMKWFATATALGREATYLQWLPMQRYKWFKVPPLGTFMLLLSYLVFVLALEFVNNSVPGAQFWQARGIRAGWLAVAQVPLLILLVGKNNLITLATGVSYERLNVLHRWSARIMLLLAIFHFGFQSRAWSDYGLMKLEWFTDDCPPTGIAAFVILLWMNLSTLAPFRYWSYEFFVVQHIITFFGFIIAVMYHLPSTALWSRIYIYIPIALYLVDRLMRTALFAWRNRKGSRAVLTKLEGDATKVTLRNCSIKRWAPGAYVLLSIPRFGWIEAHPATILSTPSSHDGNMVFILRSHKGFTKRIMVGANDSSEALLPTTKQEAQAQQNAHVVDYWATLNGPYGGSHEDFAAFDSVLLIGASTGITFTLAILQDMADRAARSSKKLPVRRVHLLWTVKAQRHAKWVKDEIAGAVVKLKSAGIEVEISIHVTCVDAFTEDTGEAKECGCKCDKSLGPCCCELVDEDGEGVRDDEVVKPALPSAGAVKDERTATITESARGSSSSASSTLEGGKQVATRFPMLPCAAFYSGRPSIPDVLTALLDGAEGESAVAVCGTPDMNAAVRNTVVRLSDQRAIHKGTGAQGCYLHVEAFS